MSLNLSQVVTRMPEWVEDEFGERLRNDVYATDEEKMGLVSDLLAAHLQHGTGGPFSAVVFDAHGKVHSVGFNIVVPGDDPTSHAEMVSIRFGLVGTGNYSFAGGNYTLASSCQPCGMCYNGVHWAGVERVIIGARREHAEALGFNEGAVPENWQDQWREWGIECVEGVLTDQIVQVMNRYKGPVYNGFGDANITSDASSRHEIEVGNAAGREYVARMEAAAAAIRARVEHVPETLIILGSGLGQFGDQVEDPTIIPYKDIPHMPVSTTAGHEGNLIVGKIDGHGVAVFQGRVHNHDGLPVQEVAFGARVMTYLGIKNLLVTNAAGYTGANEGSRVGDLMVFSDHISLVLPNDPSFGLEHPVLGPKFYSLSGEGGTSLYDVALRAEFLHAASEASIRAHAGVYWFNSGPRYETPAEVKIAKILGGDAVGMSTVPEVIAVHQMNPNVRVLAVSVFTNPGAGIGEIAPNHEEVKAAGDAAGPNLERLFRHLLKTL